jgi:hypothetical protein
VEANGTSPRVDVGSFALHAVDGSLELGGDTRKTLQLAARVGASVPDQWGGVTRGSVTFSGAYTPSLSRTELRWRAALERRPPGTRAPGPGFVNARAEGTASGGTPLRIDGRYERRSRVARSERAAARPVHRHVRVARPPHRCGRRPAPGPRILARVARRRRGRDEEPAPARPGPGALAAARDRRPLRRWTRRSPASRNGPPAARPASFAGSRTGARASAMPSSDSRFATAGGRCNSSFPRSARAAAASSQWPAAAACAPPSRSTDAARTPRRRVPDGATAPLAASSRPSPT